jgi:carboxyl-terminal processing protease
MSPNTKHRFTPLLIALGTIVGIFIGTAYTSHFTSGRISIINTGSSKVGHLLQLIDNNYVDTVDMNSLIEDAMPQILSELDPHSRYFNPKDAEEASEDLRGSFSGIGVQFRIERDTVNVLSVIHGGPAEKVGILAGDRIVSADTTSLVGMGDNDVMKCLKGVKGSEVKLGIKRHGTTELQYFTVVRGDIPVVSVDAYFMKDEHTGYIHVKNFGEQTYAEMLVALANLNMKGMEQLIMDLRGNQGGYMHVAIQMVNEFLPANNLIVYTEGRKSPREEFHSDGRGTFQKLPIVVLVDEFSASASEIFAGAIQDNDRGVIVGRRSFGKGLVQEPINFTDGSGLRVTVARFYTPSGRCIQKPYDKNYEYDIYERYAHGEMTSADSMKVDTTALFYTVKGRRVYGGGGIIPDVFVPIDTTLATRFYINCNKKAVQMRFAASMFDKYRGALSEFEDFPALENWMDKIDIEGQFLDYAASVEKLTPKQGEWEKTRPYMMPQLKALVGRYSKLDDEAFYRFYLPVDETIQAALKNPSVVD